MFTLFCFYLPEKEQTMRHTIYVENNRCKGVDGCGLCIHVCPKNVYEKSGVLTDKGVYPPEIAQADLCNGCKLCMIYCPDLVITVETEPEKVKNKQ